jgi:hypothetical protein
VVNFVLVASDTLVALLQARGGDAGRVGTYCLNKKLFKPLLRLSSPSRALVLSPSKQYVATFEKHTLHAVQITPGSASDAKPPQIKLYHTKTFTVRCLFTFLLRSPEEWLWCSLLELVDVHVTHAPVQL